MPQYATGLFAFTTWTRGHAWILCGYAEQLEWLTELEEKQFEAVGYGKGAVIDRFADVAKAAADFYWQQTPTDGIPYWDTGAPGLAEMGDWSGRPAEPDNPFEPVDSSAAAIAAQGLLRLGNYLTNGTKSRGKDSDSAELANRYLQAGLTVARTLLTEPYLSEEASHEGLLRHSVYHHPNGWDYVPPGKSVPLGEASMWGDYHLMELAVYLKRLAEKATYYTFFDFAH